MISISKNSSVVGRLCSLHFIIYLNLRLGAIQRQGLARKIKLSEKRERWIWTPAAKFLNFSSCETSSPRPCRPHLSLVTQSASLIITLQTHDWQPSRLGCRRAGGVMGRWCQRCDTSLCVEEIRRLIPAGSVYSRVGTTCDYPGLNGEVSRHLIVDFAHK